MKRWVLFILVILLVWTGAAAESVELTPVRDSTLYESATGALANGSGAALFAGRTGQLAIRRLLVDFDVAASIPPGSIVQSATLELTVVGTNTGPFEFGLHRVSADWGESTSVAPGNGGGGTAAAAGDATWLHTFFDTQFWAQAGGDFAALPSATAEVAANGSYTWGSTPEMVADVQSWLDDDSTNHGWIVLEPTTGGNSSKRFNSREAADLTAQPTLRVEYMAGAVCGDGIVENPEECDDGNLFSNDGCSATCTVDEILPVPTVGQWGMIIMTLLMVVVATRLFSLR